MAWTRARAIAELNDGPTQIRVGTKAFVVVKQGDDVWATEALCPHKFAPLSEGHIDDGCLVCPVHEAGFHLATGAPRDGDGWAGQLQTFPCRVVDGTLEIDA